MVGLGAPSISHRHHHFPMEVPFAKGKWPCPVQDEIPGLNCPLLYPFIGGWWNENENTELHVPVPSRDWVNTFHTQECNHEEIHGQLPLWVTAFKCLNVDFAKCTVLKFLFGSLCYGLWCVHQIPEPLCTIYFKRKIYRMDTLTIFFCPKWKAQQNRSQ